MADGIGFRFQYGLQNSQDENGQSGTGRASGLGSPQGPVRILSVRPPKQLANAPSPLFRVGGASGAIDNWLAQAFRAPQSTPSPAPFQSPSLATAQGLGPTIAGLMQSFKPNVSAGQALSGMPSLPYRSDRQVASRPPTVSGEIGPRPDLGPPPKPTFEYSIQPDPEPVDPTPLGPQQPDIPAPLPLSGLRARLAERYPYKFGEMFGEETEPLF